MRLRLIQARKDKNMTQEQFGVWLGVRRETISDWESGAVNPNRLTRETISKKLKVPEKELFFNDDEKGESIMEKFKKNNELLLDIVEVCEITNVYDVNLHLEQGWKLLDIVSMRRGQDDHCSFYIVGRLSNTPKYIDKKYELIE